MSTINTGERLLRRIFTGVIGAAIGLTGILFAVPHVVPHSFEKATIEKVLSYVLGHPVEIMGSTSFRLVPTLSVLAENLVILGSEGGEQGRPVLADVQSLDLEIGVFGLLANEISVQKLHINSPQIRLVRDKSGAGNWQHTMIPANAIKEPDLDWGWWQDMQIGDVQITNGRFVYANSSQRQKITGEKFNIRAFISSATGAGKGVSLAGSVQVNGENVEVRVDIGAVEKLLAGGRLPVVASISSAFGLVGYQGAIAKRQYLVSDGRFSIEAPDIVLLEKWIGPIFDAPIEGELKITGRLNKNGSRIDLDDLKFVAGTNRISGKVLLANEIKGRRIDAALYVPDLDLQPFVSFGLSPSWFGVAQGIIKANWSRVSYGPIILGPGQISFALKSNPRRINVTLPATEVYGGQGRAEIQLAMGEGMTSFKGQLELNRINADSFFTNFGSLAKISGNGDLRLNLFSVGGNYDELLSALRGNGDFNLLAGQVHEEVLAEYLMRGSPGSVPFTQMIGSFSVHQGIIEGSDLLLKAPDLSLVGDGFVDLARDFVDVRLQSLHVDTAKKSKGLIIIRPFRISGTLRELELTPEDS